MSCSQSPTTVLRNLLFVLIFFAMPRTVRADEVTDWNKVLLQTTHVATTSSTVASRNAAIVESSVFDAINGIRYRYTPIHVKPAAPEGASVRAAAIQAAYASLLHLYPTQAATLNAALAASLANLPAAKGGYFAQERNKQSIADGLAWGQTVADAIWQWRSTDGFTPTPPPFLGGGAVGEWRPTPPAFASGAGVQFSYMTPWVLHSPDQFRAPEPPPLNSLQYAFDFYETEIMGSATSTLRTADQTLAAQFWNSTTPIYSWNSVAALLSERNHFSLLRNARLFALVNLALADGTISDWESKYHYVRWRPVTAIPLAGTDGNPWTAPDPNWLPLITTPAHPEYPSAHSAQSTAAVTILAHFFGERTAFVVSSDGLPGVQRSFASFNDALLDIDIARIYGGIHYRSSCNEGRKQGRAVANFILRNALQGSGADEGADPEYDEAK